MLQLTLNARKELENPIKTALLEETCLTNRDLEISTSHLTLPNKKSIITGVGIGMIGQNFKDNDPYLKDISIDSDKAGNIEIGEEIFLKYSPKKWDQDTRDLHTFKRKLQWYYSTSMIDFPVLIQDNRYAISRVDPFAINTYNRHAAKAAKRVLHLNIGLGHDILCSAINERVTGIDVVEGNPNVEHIYKEHILDKTPNKDKINQAIIADPLAFLQTAHLKEYDTIAYYTGDTGIEIIVPYLTLLAQLPKMKEENYTFSQEESIYIDLQREILDRILRMIIAPGAPIANKGFIPGLDILAKHIIETSNGTINTAADLSRFISIENLKILVRDFAINCPDGIEKIKQRIIIAKYIEDMMAPFIQNPDLLVLLSNPDGERVIDLDIIDDIIPMAFVSQLPYETFGKPWEGIATPFDVPLESARTFKHGTNKW